MTTTPTRSVFALAADWFDPPEDSGIGEDRELAIACSKDLRLLIREAWPLLEPARPFVEAWHIDTVCEHLMAVSAGEIPRLLINQPPNTSKSITVAVCWPAWDWLLNPHLRWMYASYSQTFAFRDSRKTRDLIQSRGGKEAGTLFERRGYQGVLALLGQGWKLKDDQNAKGRYDTTAGGFRLATGIGGGATGDHGDRICVDDPLNPEQAYSAADRGTVNRWWDGTMKSRFIDESAAAVIVHQRLHSDDLTGHLLAAEREDWHHLFLPAEYMPGHQFTYPASTPFVLPNGEAVSGDPRTERGELLDPIRLSEAALVSPRKTPSVYAGQYQQLPAPEGGGMFREEWWHRRWEPGFDAYLEHGFDRVVQSWDMAFKGTKTSDYVTGQVWGFHGADCYLLAQVRGRFDFAATLHVVKALSDFEPRALAKLVEDKANGPAVVSALRRKIPGLIEVTPRGSKYARAQAESPRVEAGNVILPAAITIPCPSHYIDEGGQRHAIAPTTVADYIHEHGVFPNGANDDMIDCQSQVLTWAKPQERAREPVMPEQVAPSSIMGGVMTEKW